MLFRSLASTLPYSAVLVEILFGAELETTGTLPRSEMTAAWSRDARCGVGKRPKSSNSGETPKVDVDVALLREKGRKGRH